jgi:hypothetical protein
MRPPIPPPLPPGAVVRFAGGGDGGVALAGREIIEWMVDDVGVNWDVESHYSA